jgi:hypothetical protein
METLSILLSTGGAGETFFIGALIGLMTWGFVSLVNRKSDSKAKLLNQQAQQIQESLNQDGGMVKFSSDLINYFEKSYKLQISEELKTCVVMYCEEYEAAIAVTFNDSDIIYIKFLNRSSGKFSDWVFAVTTSHEEIINKIDSDIRAKLL